jgi:hypothetical protein
MAVFFTKASEFAYGCIVYQKPYFVIILFYYQPCLFLFGYICKLWISTDPETILSSRSDPDLDPDENSDSKPR